MSLTTEMHKIKRGEMDNRMKLSYKDLKSTSKLFWDFLNDFEKVAPYYCANFRRIDRFEKNASNMAKRDYKREELVAILTEQNKSYGFAGKTFDNIEKLRDTKSCVVFTGQQVGLLTGPMYTVYKTLTALKLAQEMEDKLDVPVVPIFWMATDDHDFEEVRHVHILDKLYNLHKIDYEPNEPPGDRPMAFFNLDDNIDLFNQEVLNSLPPSDYHSDIREMISDSYQPGQPIGEAFGRLLAKLFTDSGLVLVNPADDRIKRMAKPVFEKEIAEFESSNQIINLANTELKQLGYHLQVHHLENYTNLFYCNGERSRIGYDGDSYFIDGEDQKFSREELLDKLDQFPNHFSPNVLLRPVMQDHLFPTLAYIGGPAEVAYFAQIKDLHNHFKVQCPIVYPRISATVMDKFACRVMEKHELTMTDFIDEKHLQAKIKDIVEEKIPAELDQKIEQDCDEINQRILSLEKYLADFDEGVQRTVRKTKGKVEYEIKQLREKIIKAYKKRNKGIVDGIERASEFLYPEQSLQERHFNIFNFIVRYGPEFMDKIDQHLKLDCYDHQVIYLEDMGY
ncbi:MAG: bacillithiol biosynthesis cysteine-adding enzyme BshC [candidate division Zixibacteria bacterium]|nr:bacillithiol biosynthesis cysteine-adding enzyme BshC [candidate division Zixibacteria bacterium]